MKLLITLYLTSIPTAVSAFAITPASKPRHPPPCLAMTTPPPRDPQTQQTSGDDGAMNVKLRSVDGFGTTTTTPIEPEFLNLSPPPPSPIPSIALPFATVPAFFDGTAPGDVGFDPLGFSTNRDRLTWYREAEIKHARLAMLAAAGWPLSESFDRKIANFLGMDAVVDVTNRAPSVLNGGMGRVGLWYWGLCLVLASAVDVVGTFVIKEKEGYFPGNFNFDPFGLYPKDEEGRKRMRTAEIKNGRLAMIAITGFCFQEFVTHVAVVDQAPVFFKPIWMVLNDQLPTYSYPDGTVLETAGSAMGTLDSSVSAFATDTGGGADAAAAAATSMQEGADAVAAAATSMQAGADAIAAAATSMPADAVSGVGDVVVPPPASVVPTASVEELAAAKTRIMELESQLAEIRELSR